MRLTIVMEQYLEPYIKTNNIFLFVPNLIGYGRIIFLLLACVFMTSWPIPTLLFYFLSSSLDAFDGNAARKYKQETRFGELLDQLTDRCGTLCLVMALACLYPNYFFLFQLSAVIDIAGHWIHGQVSLMAGNSSHKIINIEPKKDPTTETLLYLLHIYYNNRIVLFSLCLANEVFYVSLYMLYYYEGLSIIGSIGLFRLVCYLTLPLAILKTLSTLLQLYFACIQCGDMDLANRVKSK